MRCAAPHKSGKQEVKIMELEKEYIEELIENKIKSAEKKYGKEFKNLLIEIIALEKSLLPEKNSHSRLIELTKWNEYHEYPTVKGMQMLYYHRKENGFEEFNVIEKSPNKRLLVNEENYFKWYEAKKSIA